MAKMALATSVKEEADRVEHTDRGQSCLCTYGIERQDGTVDVRVMSVALE